MSDLISKFHRVDQIGNKIEYHLRNSIEMELLMQLEDEGLGHWTLSQLLNYLQDMYTHGETESFYTLANRKKKL